MRWSPVVYALPLSLLPLVGCRGCLDLDEYELVPNDGAIGSGGSGGSGGSSGESCLVTDFSGTVFGTFDAAQSSSTSDSDCAIPVSAGAGIDVVALEPRDGSCVARARLVASGDFAATPRIHHSRDGTTVLAGKFARGSLELPLRCATSGSVVLDAAGEALFIAKLRLETTVLCTEWARAISSTAAGASPLDVHDVETSSDGSIAIAGSLGGATVEFDDAAGGSIASGGAFIASWSPSGAFRGVTALAVGSASDAFYGLSAAQSSWLATGALLVEDPMCHACSGTSHVTDGANRCSPAPDAGAGGVAGSGGADAGPVDSGLDVTTAGAGGMGGVGDDASSAGGASAGGASTGGSGSGGFAGGSAPDAAVTDTVNAVLMAASSAASCTNLDSFGSDRFADDAQAGLSISRRESACGADFAGRAGRDTWRLIGTSPQSALAAGSDAVSDGFIARFAGGASVGCTSGGPSYSLRLEAAGSVSADRIASARCSDASTALVFARGAAGGSIALRRCGSDGACATASRSASLAESSAEQVAVLGLDGNGTLAWHGAFGSLNVDALSLRPRADLALDRLDHAYLVLETSNELWTHNLDTANCAALAASSAPSGVWIVAIGRQGSGDKAVCRWARRL